MTFAHTTALAAQSELEPSDAARRPRIHGVRLVFLDASHDEREFDRLEAEFPGLAISRWSDCSSAEVLIHEAEWPSSLVDFKDWDTRMAEAARRQAELAFIGGEGLCQRVFEILTRYQRYFPRRNQASQTYEFEQVLDCHEKLHDLAKPLVSADYDHALDVWQWTLRLDPVASAALQIAALFHDIERLETEAEQRIEQYAPDYQAFKDAHARGGANFTTALLKSLELDPAVIRRVARLIELHERPHLGQREAEASTLADADALSFFTLNSPGFVDYYGTSHATSKVAYSLGRMTPRARCLLGQVKLRADVRALLEQVLLQDPSASRRPLVRQS